MFGVIEVLEWRQLLAATLSGQVLTVRGDAGSSSIVIRTQGRHLNVTVNGASERFTTGSFTRIDVIAYSGDDNIDLTGVLVTSRITSGAGDDTIYGGDASDQIEADAGSDAILAQGGDDRIDGGEGADLISGGNGQDTADYSDSTNYVDVSIARGGYDDGAPGEGDNVRSDMEAVIGSGGDDYIVGWHANDFISGGDGNDTVIGDRGYDTINGDDGDDDLSGDDGNDRMSGGNGDDYLDGGDDSNRLYGGPGDDFLNAHNDKTDDGIDGGSGWDVAKVDFWWGTFDVGDEDNTTHVEDHDWFEA